MSAYRWNGPGTGLSLEKIPKPKPTAHQILLKVEACGICHSDCHILDGSGAEWIKMRPITLGHEVSGTIEDLGSHVSGFEISDRVVAALIAHPVRVPAIGLDINGGYAEYAVADISTIVPIPRNVSFEQAAVSTDALLTAYHAIAVQGEIHSGQTVAIIGLGGLGMMASRLCVLRGAVVYGVDTDESKFERAKEMGVKECATNLKDVKDVVFDVVMDFVGFTVTINAALDAVKENGRVVLVGLGGQLLSIAPMQIVLKNVELRGSLGGSKAELEIVLGLIADGSLEPDLQEIHFENLHEAFHLLEMGKTKGRLFTRPKYIV
ncbi:alcohol dehydrogenase GroES-like domain-containing protein [Melanomma pulvis-pyrius CBS 109.77]|uniref:Alcohol dehydrogenase GroES-like domain-containing protein n=1 Tax=Melanomma pulvis-pyrius CBS 109.77 TaxID=1314802 RepID=A0A6A6XT56_9PLEO|nr:alcohol dehydrogenase GroES-like domain-containing protein [Melanomma pulvis-pyrius CBS 109.77]